MTPAELEQRRSALAKGNDIRSRRAELKREVRAGRRSVADLLDSPPEWLRTATVYEILLAVPRMGPNFVRRATGRAGVLATDTFDMLTPITRQALLEELAETPAHRCL